MKVFEDRFGKLVIKFRWAIIAVTLLSTAFFAYGAGFLGFSNDARIYFSEENPQLKALEIFENTYSKSENVFFIIMPKNKNVFTPKTLAAIEDLTEASWLIPYATRVDSITNFQHTRAEGDELIIESLVKNAITLSEKELLFIKDAALNEPNLLNRLISSTGDVTAVNIDMTKPGKSTVENSEIGDYTDNLAEQFRTDHPEIDLYVSGGIPFDLAFGEAGERDFTTLMPIMFVTLLLIVGFSLRSYTGTITTLLVIILSIVAAMGMAGWLGFVLNPASGNAPIIILTLAVADCVHVLSTIFQQLRAGKDKYEAISESLRINIQPVFLTSATTAIGFLTMNFSDAPPFRDLGNIVAMGVMFAFVYSLTFLPAVIAILPIRQQKAVESKDIEIFSKFADFVLARRKGLFWGMLAVIVFLSAGIFRITLEDNFSKYFDSSYDVRVASDFSEKHLTGFNIIEYSLDSGEEGGISDPDYLSTLENFANWYRSQENVAYVSVITDTMKRLNKSMHGDDQSFYRIPEKRDLAAQYLLLYEMSVPFGLDLNNQINIDKSATRMTIFMGDATTSELRAMEEKAHDWLELNAPQTMRTDGTGMSIVFSHISKRNIDSMLGASIGALVIISLTLIIALKSLKLGLLSLIPNLAPAFMAFGVWGYAVGEVGLTVSVLAALTLGIVVDDTVHFMSKYLRARRELDMAPPEAVKYSFKTVGLALTVTTASLAAGFLVLSLSGFKINADMGLMTAITITIALILDFLLLPALLLKVDGEPEGDAGERLYQKIPAYNEEY